METKVFFNLLKLINHRCTFSKDYYIRYSHPAQTNAYSNSTIETVKKGVQKSCFDDFIVNFEHVSHLFLVFLLFNLNR